MTRVYRYACKAPFEKAELVSRQFALAHEYRNGLVAIERARRGAVRAVEDTAEVRAAIEVAKGATKSMRREAMKLLREARKLARDAAADELERIEALNRSIVKDAYNLYGDRGLAWGTRLRIAAAADAARREPIYGDDGHSPLVPHFHRWDGSGTCVVQLQHGLAVADLLRGGDTRASIERGVDMRPQTRAVAIVKGGFTDAVLSLRIGSDGRAPVWARWPVTTMHRALPNEGRVTWIAATCNRAGLWSCEITVTGITDRSDVASSERRGAIAVEVCWYDRGIDGICAATWLDSDGKRGSVIVPTRVVGALRKAFDIRSLRDLSIGDQHAVDGRLLRAGIRTTLGRSLRDQATSDPLPQWLARARDTVEYWKSPSAFRALAQRWRRERCDAGREAYDLLQEWELRDAHLLDYEAGARRGGLKTRDQLYHTIAIEWAGRYDQVIVDNRNLSREARWGSDSDVRFLTAPSDLRNALRDAFGWRTVELPHKSKDAPPAAPKATSPAGPPPPSNPGGPTALTGALAIVDADGDEVQFCERAIDAYLAGTARAVKIERDPAAVAGGAWARRKAKKRAKVDAVGAARESVGKCAE
jgi:hypothetical protein